MAGRAHEERSMQEGQTGFCMVTSRQDYSDQISRTIGEQKLFIGNNNKQGTGHGEYRHTTDYTHSKLLNQRKIQHVKLQRN